MKLNNLKTNVEDKTSGLYKIYIIEFYESGKVYIGRTRTDIRKRIASHIFDSKLKSDTSLHWEFNRVGITKMEDFDLKCSIILLIDSDQSDNSQTEKKLIQSYERKNSKKLLNILLRKNRP